MKGKVRLSEKEPAPSTLTFTVASLAGTFVFTSKSQVGEHPAARTLVTSEGARSDERIRVANTRGTFALKAS